MPLSPARAELRRARAALLAALGALVAVAALAATATAAVPVPTLSGPIINGERDRPATSVSPLIRPLYQASGYGREREYFFSGTARAYTAATPLSSDGTWTTTVGDTAGYKTRLLVRLPDRRRFNGTIYVEWLNVSQGFDSDSSFSLGDAELLRRGYGWVGVDAQKVGIDGGDANNPLTRPGFGLKQWDPTRYGSLVHPGDSFSYDIFSQAVQALRHPGDVNPLQDLGRRGREARFIGMGISQSAIRLATYIDAVGVADHVYDGYMVHSRGGGAPLSQAPQPDIPAPTPLRIRTDIGVPVLQWLSEPDVQYLGFWQHRQPASEHVRTWEVAGASHNDQYLVDRNGPIIARDYPDYATSSTGGGCDNLPMQGVSPYSFRAAIRALGDWVAGGPAPRQSPRLLTDASGVIQRDEWGNAYGGIRTPAVDVPTQTLTADNTPAANFCYLLGSRLPFDQATLGALYASHADYVQQVSASARLAVARGWLLREDADELRRDAWEAPIP